tara:strand:- start:386 stop:1081 length:696 start_codon:yes stop_codon:yes gene_type:complete
VKLKEKNINLLIDFDSTFVTVETLDILADICLNNDLDKINKIKSITDMAMDGKIPFDKALLKRIQILKANKTHINKTLKIIKKNVSESFKKNKIFFKKNADNCFIISGGFKEIIYPIVKEFGFKKQNVFGNEFIYKSNGKIKTINKNNPLAQRLGKIKIADQIDKNLSINEYFKTALIIGDGYTDYEVKKFNKAKKFIQYTETINRKNINNHADFIAKNFNEVISYINSLF